MIERVWTATVSWGDGGRDLDILATVTAGGQTTSGVGWNNGQETSKIVVSNAQTDGTFYAIWGGDDTTEAGSETVTVYFRGTKLPAGSAEVATLTTHLNFYGEGSSPVTVAVSGQAGSYTGSANTRYHSRAEVGDPAITVPILAGGGSEAQMYLVELSSSPQDGGTAFGGGLFADGATCTVRATPNSGATFIGWYEGETQVSTDSSYTFTVGSDRSLVAHFTVHVAVAADPTEGGTVTGGGDFALGAACTISATPGDGYKFSHWTNDLDSTRSTDATHSLAVRGNVTWTAHFERLGIWILAATHPAGIGDAFVNPPSAPLDVKRCNYGRAGDEARLVAAVTQYFDGWRFVQWRGAWFQSSQADVRLDLSSQAQVDAWKTYNENYRKYALYFTADFAPVNYKTVKLRIVEGAEFGTLRSPLAWGFSAPAQSDYVTVTKNTATEYEARVPMHYIPDFETIIYDPHSGSPTAAVMPKVTKGGHVYKYVVALDGVETVYEAHPYQEGSYPGHFNEDSYQDNRYLYNMAGYFAPEEGYVVSASRDFELRVDFYLRHIATGKLLCTGVDSSVGAGRMLCNSSGQLMFAG